MKLSREAISLAVVLLVYIVVDIFLTPAGGLETRI
jgi:hypothetical protein